MIHQHCITLFIAKNRVAAIRNRNLLLTINQIATKQAHKKVKIEVESK
jgi:hypothetical protein